MSEQGYRSAGAMTGLVIGLVTMSLVGHWGLVAAFCFGVGGTLIGARIGERLHGGGRRE